MKIQAQLNKRLFYPDEAVKVELEVDNSHSSRDIKEIRCSLKHEITIRKGKTALQNISNTLCMLEKIEINKRERK
jgi:sporulation-control protein spo0M